MNFLAEVGFSDSYARVEIIGTLNCLGLLIAQRAVRLDGNSVDHFHDPIEIMDNRVHARLAGTYIFCRLAWQTLERLT